MNIHLENIIKLLQDDTLPEDKKEILLKAITDADKQWAITEFKLDRTEKVKRTTAILLEETIEELEQKRKAVEAQNRELEIESSLERVRTVAMGMKKPDDLLQICEILFKELRLLGFAELRNAIIHTFVDQENYFNDYDYSDFTGGCVSRIPYTGNSLIEDFVNRLRKANAAFTEHIVTGKELDEWRQFRIDNGEADDPRLEATSSLYYYVYSVGPASIGISTFSAVPDVKLEVLKRFRNVFEFAYSRYTDVAKAEAQAREARIEAALERVRSRSMGMQKSNELKEVIQIVYDQFVGLNINVDHAGFVVDYEPGGDWNFWIADKRDIPNKITHPYFDSVWANQFNDAKEKGIDFFSTHLNFEEKNKFYRELLSHVPGLPEESRTFYLECPGLAISTVLSDNVSLYIENFSGIAYTNDENAVLIRFGKVFRQTYTRFLDLQKAEAQAREAEIELALERVRSRAMAMHSSQELKDVATELRNQMSALGQTDMEICAIHLYDESPDYFESIAAGPVFDPTLKSILVQVQVKLPKQGIRIIEEMMNQYHSGKKDYVLVNHGKRGVEWFELLKEKVPLAYEFVIQNLNGTSLQDLIYYWSVSDFKGGALVMTTYVPPADEARKILSRLANVFGLAYQRFKDLKKAEAQAREAQIEAALERVRAKTMAMHTSEQLAETAKAFFEQFDLLGKIPDRMSIGIFNEESKKVELWVTDQRGKQVNHEYFFSIDERTSIAKIYAAWKERKDTIIVDLTGQNLQDWLQFVKEEARLPIDESKIKGRRVQQAAFFSKGFLLFTTHEPVAGETMQLLVRFARVFDLTYTRFLDLQKAEAQAREAQIEAALERVRGNAMAMHSSRDLSATIGVFYRELETFSITPRRCGVGLLNKETRMAELSTMNTTEHGDSIEIIGTLKMEGHPVLEGVYDSWLFQQEYHPVLRGNEIKEYYQLLRPQIGFPDYPNDAVQYGYFFFFNEGGVYAWTEKEMKEDELQIYRRFTTVLSLTYKRYIDLKQAEANAKEAIKQAALDRIRADIASMRTIGDLDRITPLIWKELTILGIPFIRCGVFIMDDTQQLIHTFLSTPDGKAIAAFHLPYDTPGNLSKVLSHWKDHQNYVDHWDESAFTDLAEVLVKQGAITSPGQYLNTIPHGGFYLHFLPFLQGMLYVGNTAQLTDEDIQLIQSVADAFSTAYARYEDFNKLEAAKQQVDKTLVELKQAQTQLVQSEKMASLGELTAGIAHEIQNPLNFVNNFSEVSTELLDEMINELSNGSKEDAIAIADDVKQNLEKILHHGKRADGIVKGMLQHSRSSTAVKEPTDINKLADEYLRLAYHGLRAKDKSFNTTLTTDFDESIGNINVIPQDIGRAILNLITNAFYVVGEKNKQAGDGYEPTVSVTTRKMDDKPDSYRVEIIVADNGNGVPQKVMDKIFQPFFTTKPTGQGTGLGLSLAYDIVKAHGGELKVESKESEGSTFIIQLP